jgi:hypothetical protein
MGADGGENAEFAGSVFGDETFLRQPSTCSTLTVCVMGLSPWMSATGPASDHLVSVVLTVSGKSVKRISGAERMAVTAAPHKPNNQPM